MFMVTSIIKIKLKDHMSSLSNILKTIYCHFYILCLFLLVGRLMPHPPNFTPILAVAILAPYIFNNRFLSFSMTIIAMFISDLIIGLHSGILLDLFSNFVL